MLLCRGFFMVMHLNQENVFLTQMLQDAQILTTAKTRNTIKAASIWLLLNLGLF